MRPSRAELHRFAEALAEVALGSVIERVWRPTETSLLIEIRGLRALVSEAQAKKPRLFVDLETKAPWVAVTTRWPETPAAPDRETLVLRKHLEGARLAAVGVEADRRLVISLHTGAELAIQLAGRYPQLGVIEGGETLVALLPTRAVRDEGSPALPERASSPELEALPAIASAQDAGAWLEAFATRCWAAADRRHLDERRARLLSLAKTALDRKRRAIAALEADLDKAGTAEATRHRGELLKGALHRVVAGADHVLVEDWLDDGARLRLELDPTLTPVENLQRLFARYKKLARGAELVAHHLEQAWEAEAKLVAALATVEAAMTDDALDAAEAALRDLGVRPPAQATRRVEEDTRLPYRRFAAADGSEILVGRTARDNDTLTFRVARGADVFLHARDVPGSHVILRRVGRAPPSSEALLDAATLAAWSSRAKNDTVIDVLWTERKNVRKVKGGAPGLVQTAAPRTLAVRIEQARLERLYRTLDPHEREG